MSDFIVREIDRKADNELRAELQKLEDKVSEFFKGNDSFVINGGWWELNKAIRNHIEKNWKEHKERRVRKILDRITKQGEIK